MATYKAVMRLALEYASSVWLPIQGFGFENGRRVINRSPWVGKGSCRRVKNHSLSVFQESYSDYHKMNLNFLNCINASPWNLLVLQISKSTDHMHR